MSRLFDGNGVVHIANRFADVADEGVANLCAAVTHQAVLDYRNNYAAYLRDNDNEKAKVQVKEIEKFFRSERFRFFSDLDAETIIMKVRRIAKKQVEERQQREVLSGVS